VSTVLAPAEPVTAPEPAAGPARVGRGTAAWLVRWRLALRMARRDARRAKGRTAIVLVMVGVPIMAVVGGETLYRTNDVTAVESLPARLGSADVLLQGVAREQVYADPVWGGVYDAVAELDRPWTADEVQRLLPAGSRVVERQNGALSYRTPIGYSTADGYAENLSDPLRDGAYEVVDGRAPRSDGEIAVSRSIAARGYAVGDRMELTRDDVPVTVVGVLDSDALGPFVVVAPEAAGLLQAPRADFFAGVQGGLDWPAVQRLNGVGIVAISRDVVEDPPAPSAYLPPGWPSDDGSSLSAEGVAVVALVVAAVLLEVVLLAGPAFAVGLRRQRRVLALMAAGGGTPADLRRTVLASGLLLGAGAAVIGGLLGIGLAAVAVPVIESNDIATLGPFDVSLRDAVVVVLVGALAGLAAAYVPARQAARTDVVITLTGRRGQVRSSWRLPVLGLLVAAGGLVLTVMGARGTELAVAGGAVLLVVGLVIATPWLVGLLAPLARRLPVAGRLAVRDATRNRTRTAPAVAAVMATVAGVTTLAVATSSDSAQEHRDYVEQYPMGTAAVSIWNADPDGWTAVREAVERYVPGRSVSEIRLPSSPDAILSAYVMEPGTRRDGPEGSWYPEEEMAFAPMTGQVAAVDADALAALTDPALRGEAAAAFRSGRAVVFGAGAVEDGQVTVQATEYDGTRERTVGRVRLPAVEVTAPEGARMLRVPASVVVPPELEDRMGVAFSPNQLLVGGPAEPVSEAEEAALTEAIAALTPDASVYVERGWDDRYWVVRLLLMVVGGLLVLVATLTATGLAVADARPDLGTLAAVGAAPRTRRLMAMGSAAVIGAFGAALGVVAGLAPGVAVAYPLTSTDYGNGAQPLVVVPWGMLAIIAVGVPLLAVLATGLVVRSRLPMATRIAG
jgi:putative ABC transport system permease protein